MEIFLEPFWNHSLPLVLTLVNFPFGSKKSKIDRNSKFVSIGSSLFEIFFSLFVLKVLDFFSWNYHRYDVMLWYKYHCIVRKLNWKCELTNIWLELLSIRFTLWFCVILNRLANSWRLRWYLICRLEYRLWVCSAEIHYEIRSNQLKTKGQTEIW